MPSPPRTHLVFFPCRPTWRPTEADRAPAALLEALPTELLTTVEELHRVFWEGTEQGRGVLRRLEAEPFRRSAASDQAVQTAPYGNR